jgi:NADH:ubiquinone oxidoreductase subunit 6 (subunit J)
MTTLDILFGAVGLITAASAVLSVTTHHLVHAALWLVVTLGTLAGCYLILGAELVALVQLLVYVGAVVVLVLFALMLTRAPMGSSPEHSSGPIQRIAAGVIGAGTTGLFAAVLLPALGGQLRPTRAGDTKGIATQLFGAWVWPFELLSLLLLVALIAALAVSRMPSVRGASEASVASAAPVPPVPPAPPVTSVVPVTSAAPVTVASVGGEST